MKFISWNVNGLRACVQKGFTEYFQEADADFFCLQEMCIRDRLDGILETVEVQHGYIMIRLGG